jgi:hypothetical protein|tara:strand:- start:130 stop:573 length:444 start_codon:yes stop_codon:yes gene_type:complete
MGKSYKSKYKPINPHKYQGNPNNIICRSSWERIACDWFDKSPSITKWASEEIAIPYMSPIDHRVHRYYPDYLIEVIEKGGVKKKYIVEVKPKKQCSPPKKQKRITKGYIYECQTYEINKAKWKAAVEFCKDNRINFKIVTEDELGIK